MKYIVLLFCLVVGISSLHATTINAQCKDSKSGPHIGIGTISCRYLEEVSGHGVHNNPRGFCQRYWNHCCETCTRLKMKGYDNGFSTSTTPVPVTKPMKPVIPQCKDTKGGPYVGFGTISCHYVETVSGHGVHNNPRGFCQKYWNHCCETCSRLKKNGYINNFSRAKLFAAKRKRPAAKITAAPQCKDSKSGPHVGIGTISCGHLLQVSGYGVHNNPKGFCERYWDHCCETCTKLQAKGYITKFTRTQSPPIEKNTSPAVKITTTPPCKDSKSGPHIGIGTINCHHLIRPSGYGVHKNPQGFCARYWDHCCETCTKLKENGYPTIPPPTTTTAVPRLPKGRVPFSFLRLIFNRFDDQFKKLKLQMQQMIQKRQRH